MSAAAQRSRLHRCYSPSEEPDRLRLPQVLVVDLNRLDLRKIIANRLYSRLVVDLLCDLELCGLLGSHCNDSEGVVNTLGLKPMYISRRSISAYPPRQSR
jgi:hypothetical protein